MKIICPKCKGKGELFNWESIMLTIGLPIAWLIERNEDPKVYNTCTKEVCYKCDGEGSIDV